MDRAETTRAFMARHQAHDYGALILEWRKICDRDDLRMDVYARQGDYDLYCVRTRSEEDGGVYLSAGMHGDEAAPPWALLEWAGTNTDRLKAEPYTIFPCLNPWGLVNNFRFDENGRDMNRLFQEGSAPAIREWREVIGSRQFRISINLHEDYDGQGMYVYELNPESRRAEAVLKAASAIIPPDQREVIDDSESDVGVIRREITPEKLPPISGLPEAIYLHFHHSAATLTVESPSEFSLRDRIDAHVLGLTAVLG